MNKRQKLDCDGGSRKRKAISIDIKIKVLKKFEEGLKVMQIARALQLSESTVRTIRLNENKIKECAKSVCAATATKVIRPRDTLKHNMEKLLHLWISEEREKGNLITSNLIQTKALSLYEECKLKYGSTSAPIFQASRGWIQGFKERFKLKNVHLYGKAAITDEEAASSYVSEFESIISEGGYSAKQVYNVDETSLFWKKLPSCTYFTQDEICAPDYKEAKDRLTLLLGGNANGDVKLKPLLMHHSKNPKSLRDIEKSTLPVMWQCNKKTWITRDIFSDWFNTYFAPFVEKYNKENHLENKALLILGNAPSHPLNLNELHPHIKVVFLPFNISTVMQPMDQGVIDLFKAYYLLKTFDQLANINSRDQCNICSFWNNFSLKKAIYNIDYAWKAVSLPVMNDIWKKIWPRCISEFQGFQTIPTVIQMTEHIVQLAQDAGFKEVDSDDVIELLNSKEQKLSNDELMENEHDDPEDQSKEEEAKVITVEELCECLKAADHLSKLISDMDPNMERSSSFGRKLDDLMSSYRQILHDKKKNSKQKNFNLILKEINFVTPADETHIKQELLIKEEPQYGNESDLSDN